MLNMYRCVCVCVCVCATNDLFCVQQMHSLLDHVAIKGRVLDACGSTGDALGLILAECGCEVTTNDINHM